MSSLAVMLLAVHLSKGKISTSRRMAANFQQKLARTKSNCPLDKNVENASLRKGFRRPKETRRMSLTVLVPGLHCHCYFCSDHDDDCNCFCCC